MKTAALSLLLMVLVLQLFFSEPEQARARFEKALDLAKTIEPEFQIRSIPEIEQRLQSTVNN